MELGNWTIAAALLIALIAVMISWRQTLRATEISVSAKELEVFADLLRDLRAPPFRRDLEAVLHLPVDLDLSSGFESLPAPSRESAHTVTALYNDIGSLLATHLVRDETILPAVSVNAMRAWNALAPAIQAERELRADTYPDDVGVTFAPHFELLVAAVRVRQQANPARVRLEPVKMG